MIRLPCVVSQGVCIASEVREVRTLDYLALDVPSPKLSRAPHIQRFHLQSFAVLTREAPRSVTSFMCLYLDNVGPFDTI